MLAASIAFLLPLSSVSHFLITLFLSCHKPFVFCSIAWNVPMSSTNSNDLEKLEDGRLICASTAVQRYDECSA